MANRISIGNHSYGYGLYVSKSGDDVLNPSKALVFDSRAGNAWTIKKIAEGSIGPNASPNYNTVNHALGYNPLVAVRWSSSIDGNNKATETYDAAFGEVFKEDSAQGGGMVDVYSDTYRDGCVWTHHDTNNIRIYNMCNEAYVNEGQEDGDENFLSNSTVYWACIVFHNGDFTGGRGL